MKKLLLTLLAVMVTVAVNAEKVSKQEALMKAQQFMRGKQFGETKAFARSGGITEVEPFYIFNVENKGGFVIISGDDRMPDILGYSDHGSLDLQTAPCNVKWLLGYYKKVANSLTEQPNKVKTRSIDRSSMSFISPLITTTWDQGTPYNDLCPVYNGHRCITGCVATAMAQVIYYNRWPQGATNKVEAYTSQPLGIEMPELDPTEFAWDNMTNADISRLMLYCGQSVKMEYGVDGSGANPMMIAPALINVFGYSQTTHQVYRNSYQDDDWELLLYKELSEGRPIIYDGQGSGGGHEFVCDGYDGNGRFHFNWGWSGSEDGFFALTNLNPGGSDYTSDQTATISIQPPTGNVVNRPKAVVKEVYYGGSRIVSRQASGSFTDINLSSTLVSDLSESMSLQIGYGLYDSDGLQQVLYEESHTFPVGEEYRMDATFAIPSTISDGTYRVVPICRTDKTANWLAAANSSDYYLEIKIDGQWMRLRTFMLSLEERTIDDVGVTTVDGITYSVYNQYDRGRATIISFGDSKPKGALNIPSQISYKSKDYYVRKIDDGLLSDCPDLTSLSLSATNISYMNGFPKLSTLELREGVCKLISISDCNLLESIEFPKSLSMIEHGTEWCSKLKTIRFTNPRQFTLYFYPHWDTESLPALKDVYFASPEPPVFAWKDGEFVVNPNTTIHVPMGAKADYEAAGWKGWNIVDDQPVPVVNGIEWGYCNGDEVSPYSLYDECGDNDGEYAIHVPAEMLAPYVGKSITQIQFYQPTEACDYVFITKPGTDYIVKQKAEILENAWMDIELSQPYTITGDELYVGVGRHGLISTYMSNIEVSAPDGFWYRTMGDDHTQGMEPGTWKYVPDQNMDYEHPIPLKFVISGDNLALDVAVLDIHVEKSSEKEDHYDATMTIQNHSQEIVKSFVVEWDVDGGHQGSKTLEADLRPGHLMQAGFSFEATFPDRYHKLNYQVTKVNGKDDALAANSSGTIPFASSDTPIEDGVQIVNNVELKEGQLWWKNYDEELNWTFGVTQMGNWLLGQRYYAATYIPYDLLGSQGTTIDGFCFPRNSLAIHNVTVWLSTTLPKSDIDADIEILDIPNSQLATEMFRDHQVAFKQSHVIPEGGVYVGYAFDITEDLNNAGCPIECTNSEKNREGAFWLKNNHLLSWSNMTSEWGNLKVQVLFGGGNYIQNTVRILDFNHTSAVLGDKSQTEVMLINDGANEIKRINYQVTGKKGGSYEKETSVLIPAFDKDIVVLELDADETQGFDEKTITITKVNGVSNMASQCFEVKGTLYTLKNKPKSVAVMEETVASHSGNAPVCISVTEKLKEMYGDQVLPIAIHRNDVMEISDYGDILNLNSQYAHYVNRKKGFSDLYYGTLPKRVYDWGVVWESNSFGIDRDIQDALGQIVPGFVNVHAVWADEDHNKIDISADTQFEMDADNLPFRLGFVLLEDGLCGEGAAWTIDNYFPGSGNGYEDPIFDKWCNMPSKIEGMKYDYVPVAAWSPYKGIEGTIPTSVKAGQANPYTFRADITGNSHIQDKTKLRAVALLLDKNTGRIINAGQAIISEPTSLAGDADNDGVVDSKDTDAIARYILTGDIKGFNFQNADVNGDKVINIVDIVLINKIK